MKIYLSKSKIKQNNQCEKMLWLEINNPKLGVFDTKTQAVFDQGRKIESLMHSFFNEKKLNTAIVKSFKNVDKITETQKYLSQNIEVIFEASFSHKGAIVQFDALVRKENGNYFAIEVKSSSSVKEDHIEDMTIQYWILNEGQTQVKLEEYYLWHVNKQATNTDPEVFFEKKNLIETLISNKAKFDEMFTHAETTAKITNEPVKPIGSHCFEPYKCKFWNYCSSKINQNYDSPLFLPNFPKKYEAINSGIDSVKSKDFQDKYSDYCLKYPLVLSSIYNNSLNMNHSAILKELNDLVFPLAFFDFETLMTAFPVLENQKPYQQLVVQFSTHKLDINESMTHSEFLWDSKKDPSRFVAESLIESLKDSGSILSYNKTFEKTQIANLAKLFPDLSNDLLQISSRFVDLMDIVKKYVYHPDLKGSYSLKEVSPALLGEVGSYQNSTIKSGSEISNNYLIFLSTENQEEKQKIKSALLDYCHFDTLNLVLLYWFLKDPKANLKEKLAMSRGF